MFVNGNNFTCYFKCNSLICPINFEQVDLMKVDLDNTQESIGRCNVCAFRLNHNEASFAQVCGR